VDAEAPRQATQRHISANVRQCQGRKETFSLRAGMAALIAAHRLRPAPTCQHIRKVKSRTASLCENSGELRSSGGRSPQPQATRPLSHPAGERERGERGGEPSTADTAKKRRTHRPKGLRNKPPSRRAQAQTKRLFWGGLAPPQKRLSSARRVKAAVGRNGGNRPTRRRRHQRGSHKENDWGIDRGQGRTAPATPKSRAGGIPATCSVYP
jgi:hypothetical protein